MIKDLEAMQQYLWKILFTIYFGCKIKHYRTKFKITLWIRPILSSWAHRSWTQFADKNTNVFKLQQLFRNDLIWHGKSWTNMKCGLITKMLFWKLFCWILQASQEELECCSITGDFSLSRHYTHYQLKVIREPSYDEIQFVHQISPLKHQDLTVCML